MPNLKTPHWEFAESLTCDCDLCKTWRNWIRVLKKVEKTVKGHIPTCRCNLCKILLQTRKSTLASELRLNLWIELGWYAEIENWRPGWEKVALDEIQQKDKWWITIGQYKPLNFWLEKFETFGAERFMQQTY